MDKKPMLIENTEIRLAELSEYENLYCDFILPYFPEDEVKPLKHIFQMSEKGLYKIAVLYETQNPHPAEENALSEKPVSVSVPAAVAYFVTEPEKNAYLLDYLAVDEKKRCKGYGGVLLRAVAEKYAEGLPVLIETESIQSAENEAQRNLRTRRNAFYAGNGARQTGLITCIFGVEYTIWEISADFVRHAKQNFVRSAELNQKTRSGYDQEAGAEYKKQAGSGYEQKPESGYDRQAGGEDGQEAVGERNLRLEEMEKIYHSMVKDELYRRFIKIPAEG